MCTNCWIDQYSTSKIDTPAVREAALVIAEVYNHHGAGGNLHIVVDDWNLEDGNLEFCSKCIDGAGMMPDIAEDSPHYKSNLERQANPDPPEQLAAERQCCDLLMALTVDERASALALYEGFWRLNYVKTDYDPT